MEANSTFVHATQVHLGILGKRGYNSYKAIFILTVFQSSVKPVVARLPVVGEQT